MNQNQFGTWDSKPWAIWNSPLNSFGTFDAFGVEEQTITITIVIQQLEAFFK
jgi:hypothetical protein